MPTPDLTASALAVIDMQRYFLDAEAEAYLAPPENLVRNVSAIIAAFRSARRPIVFTKHAHAKDDDAGQMVRWWNGRLPRKGDPESELIAAIELAEGDRLITKKKYSAFEETDLDSWLRERGVETLVLCGVMTNLCVETTARHAFLKDFQPVVVEDACASNSRERHDASMSNLEYGFAFVLETSAIIDLIEEGR